MQPRKAGTELLTRWKDLPAFEDSREPVGVIQQQFPAFNLEDKVQVLVADDVKPPIQITYARRRKKTKGEIDGQQVR